MSVFVVIIFLYLSGGGSVWVSHLEIFLKERVEPELALVEISRRQQVLVCFVGGQYLEL